MTQPNALRALADELLKMRADALSMGISYKTIRLDLIEQAANALSEHGGGGEAEPFGWVFQHDETGRMTFCPNDGVNTPEVFAELNPRYTLCGPAYTTPPTPSAPAEDARLLACALAGAYAAMEMEPPPATAELMARHLGESMPFAMPPSAPVVDDAMVGRAASAYCEAAAYDGFTSQDEGATKYVELWMRAALLAALSGVPEVSE